MKRILPILAVAAATALFAQPLWADTYFLLNGIDARHSPGTERLISPSPGPGFPNRFYDGDRLAGTPDVGPVVAFQGIGTPMFDPNQFGAASFLFRRGSIPAGGSNRIPIMGIEYLAGPLLDLDGDLNNGQRSLVPVLGQTPVIIPGTASYIGLSVDTDAGRVSVTAFDVTGTNEGGPGIQAEIATTLTVLAGTSPTGDSGAPINPDFDTRTGTLSPFGESGGLANVFRIDDLRVEFWHDSIDPNSASAGQLGTFQHFARFRGWLVGRDPQSGQFPTLAGHGLGSTLWPAIDTMDLNATFNTANGLAGGTATIRGGPPSDQYANQPNGTPLAGGDLGQYFDTVIVPRIDPGSDSFVYLESAAFGINNSGDPVFTDTIGYDMVVIAQAAPPLPGDLNADGVVDQADAALLAQALVDPDSVTAQVLARADVNRDGSADGLDVQSFLEVLP